MAKNLYANPTLVREADRAAVRCVLMEYKLGHVRTRMRATLPETRESRLMHDVAGSAGLYLSLIRGWLATSTLVPNELIAWPTRYLFELNLILWYALSSAKGMDEYQWSMPHDHRQVLEAFQYFVKSDSAKRTMQERIKADTDFEMKHSLRPKRFPNWQTVAECVGAGDEYHALYRLLSKLTHPTAWRMLNRAEAFDSDVLRCVFVIRASEYAAGIYRIISGKTDIKISAPRGFRSRSKSSRAFAEERQM